MTILKSRQAQVKDNTPKVDSDENGAEINNIVVDGTEDKTPLLLREENNSNVQQSQINRFAFEVYDSLNLPSSMRNDENAFAILLMV